ncbi:unnamed protein product [Pleuronectes platessa]|uniref:Uncharacterized protein n=1 Tax=Pleuronectes platessa TaxID=8262 RepID=A0A9N7Y4G7_PLEPL|nr:unnamed protein product [Pleuronectes platessa]
MDPVSLRRILHSCAKARLLVKRESSDQCVYIPIKCGAPMTREPQRATRGGTGAGLSSTDKHTRRLQEDEAKTKKSSKKSAWRERAKRTHVFPVPFPVPVFTAAVLGASLSSSIKCQADHIDAPPSPQQSLISVQSPTLRTTANGVREAGELLAASPLWLAGSSRQSYPRSLFSSMSSSAGAVCLKIISNRGSPCQHAATSRCAITFGHFLQCTRGMRKEAVGRRENGYLYLLAPELLNSDPRRIF